MSHHCARPFTANFQGGDAGSQAAISELIKEATLLSSMRHPNVVWVYGIVLKPMSKDDEDDEDDGRDSGSAPVLLSCNVASEMRLLVLSRTRTLEANAVVAST